jgi:heat shock protein HslJ
VPADAAPTLTIDGGTWSGRAHCNRYTAGVRLDGSTMRSDAIAVTELACLDEQLMAAERRYLAAFSASRSAAVSGDRLTLLGIDTELVFERPAGDDATTASSGAAAPATTTAPLIGTEWQLEALLDTGASAPATPAEGAGTLLLGDDGRISGGTGCNRIMGGYEVVDDHTLRFGALASTRMACPDPLASQEAHVVAVLDGDVEVTLGEGQLILTAADGRGLRFRSDG